MNLREITIGRLKNCDIYLDSRCVYASNIHATLYYDGSQLMLRDQSTNGTMINNINVHKRAVPINHGDTIMIAGKYQINWNQIDAYFPPFRNAPTPGPSTEASKPVKTYAAERPDLSGWCWGAFTLSWIWGFFHGCWWMILVSIGLSIIEYFIPFGVVISIGISILFGVKGSQWSWENKTWSSVEEFNKSHEAWNKAGLIVFIIGIFLIILSAIALIGGLFTIANSVI